MQKQYLTCREAQPVPPYDAEHIAQGVGGQLASFLFPLLVQLDAVLDKVARSGIESLTREEKALLEQISGKYRRREQSKKPKSGLAI